MRILYLENRVKKYLLCRQRPSKLASKKEINARVEKRVLLELQVLYLDEFRAANTQIVDSKTMIPALQLCLPSSRFRCEANMAMGHVVLNRATQFDNWRETYRQEEKGGSSERNLKKKGNDD